MNILYKPEQATVPVNQPSNFPTFYPFPETGYIHRKRASNQPAYHQHRTPTHIQRQVTKPRGFLARHKLRFHQHCAAAWSQLKALGRELIRKLFWRVILPLSVACALWIPAANPAELPL
jgi:hypothetical protein